MSNASDYLEEQLIDHIFRAGTFNKPSTLAVALTKTVPTDSQTGATIEEIDNAGGYARVDVGAPSNSLWDAVTGGNGQTRNTEPITFPTATADWGWASGFAILDSTTHGAGNVIVYGELNPAKVINDTDTFSFASGNLDITVS